MQEVINDSSIILSQLAVEFEDTPAPAAKGWFSKSSKVDFLACISCNAWL